MNDSRDQLRDAVSDVARAIGARLVVLFGSSARAEGRTPEDLDLGILGPDPFDPIDVTNQLIRRLGIQNVDVVDPARADPLLLALVARDGIPLYEEPAGGFARFVSLACRRYADTRKFRATERREILDFLAESAR